MDGNFVNRTIPEQGRSDAPDVERSLRYTAVPYGDDVLPLQCTIEVNLPTVSGPDTGNVVELSVIHRPVRPRS